MDYCLHRILRQLALVMTCPNYKTDALCRKDDVDRYDDRDLSRYIDHL
ncbi:hypothetical protein [Candidatus Symbiothrix dinenymphae]|nr:hypothetical protein [Candidatus Symbiothrix dinenymphae]